MEPLNIFSWADSFSDKDILILIGRALAEGAPLDAIYIHAKYPKKGRKFIRISWSQDEFEMSNSALAEALSKMACDNGFFDGAKVTLMQLITIIENCEQ